MTPLSNGRNVANDDVLRIENSVRWKDLGSFTEISKQFLVVAAEGHLALKQDILALDRGHGGHGANPVTVAYRLASACAALVRSGEEGKLWTRRTMVYG